VAGVMTRPAAAGSKGSNGDDKKEVVVPRPFVAGSRPIGEAKYDESRAFTTTQVRMPSFSVSPTGFLGGVWMLFENVTAGNAATVVFADDAPWNAADSIYFQDVGSQPLDGPYTGYDLYIIDKYGGYHFQGDQKASPIYSVTAGAGATGGSFTFPLYIPIEIVHRDALGVLPNTSASATFKLDVSLAPSATVYDTVPTNAGTCRVRYFLEGFQDPDDVDINGQPVSQNPPAPQTTQYWQKGTLDVNTGAYDKPLDTFNGLMRNLVFINYRNADLPTAGRANGDADWADPFTFMYEKNILWDAVPRTLWRHWIATHYGYDAGTETSGGGSAATTAKQRDLGVYPMTWARDFGLKVGAELRLSYPAVSDATNLSIKGSAGATDKIVILYNYVRYNGDPRALTMGK